LAVAVDIDPLAIKLTNLNLSVNGLRAAIVQSDLTGSLSTSSRFDFVIVNPPWRIVPPGVAYPNPIARVGPGVNGLDYVRQILGILPRLLVPGGESVMRFDIPLDASGENPLCHEVEVLLGCGCSIDFTTLGEISVERQAEISADTCWHLNSEMPDLRQRFIDYYSFLKVSALSEVKCIVRNERIMSSGDRTRSHNRTETLIQGSI
jgi:methylase of polypeptide subunit release factors